MKTHIYCPDPESPAFDVTPRKTVAAYDDEAALAAFADAVDVVTYEFENVPAATAEFLAALKAAAARRQCRSRSRRTGSQEKAFLSINRIPVAPFAAIPDAATLLAELAELGVPAVLKTTRLGYDGKGQRTIRDAAEAERRLRRARAQAAGARGLRPVREGNLGGRRARHRRRRSRAFEAAENVHRDHILKTSTVPADISAATAEEAHRLATAIVDALDYVGVLGVEFFVLPGGKLLGQRDRPARPQFRPLDRSGLRHRPVRAAHPRHRRLAAGRPDAACADVVMENLIGDEVAAIPGAPRARHPPAALRQGRVAAGPEDGPHQPDWRRKRRAK